MRVHTRKSIGGQRREDIDRKSTTTSPRGKFITHLFLDDSRTPRVFIQIGFDSLRRLDIRRLLSHLFHSTAPTAFFSITTSLKRPPKPHQTPSSTTTICHNGRRTHPNQAPAPLSASFLPPHLARQIQNLRSRNPTLNNQHPLLHLPLPPPQLHLHQLPLLLRLIPLPLPNRNIMGIIRRARQQFPNNIPNLPDLSTRDPCRTPASPQRTRRGERNRPAESAESARDDAAA